MNKDEMAKYVQTSDIWDSDTTLLGEARLFDQSIRLRGDVTENVLLSTAIHELVHAYSFTGGYHLEDDEAICDFFGANGEMIVTQAQSLVKKYKDMTHA